MDMAISVRRVSIPQAVSTVATLLASVMMPSTVSRFNTANDKYCCNLPAKSW